MPAKITSKSLKSAHAARTGSRRAEREAEVRRDDRTARLRGRNDLAPDLRLEHRPLDALRPADRRVRKPDPDQMARVARSIERFGIVTPVLIRDDGAIVDGHAVVEAARAAGLEMVPCIAISHLNDTEIRALSITLNRLGERGEWDMDILRSEVLELIEADFDVEVLGFDAADLDLVLLDDDAQREAADALPEPLPVKISQLGDLWQLGDHRLLCGDALDTEAYARLLGDEQARVLFTDPPYNIPIAGFVGGLGKHQHADFAMGVGEMTRAEFQAFLSTFLGHARDRLIEGGVAFVCIDWRGAGVVVDAGEETGLRHINTIVWNKGAGGMGGLYRSAHELIPVFVHGKTPSTNNVELGRHGRDRTNVWSYPGANRRGSSAAAQLAHHPTPKPVELVADALHDVTSRGDIVLDPFSGSGTTIVAAEQTQRCARVIELDPGYVDLAVRRWETLTGHQAIHADSGETFAAIAARRAPQSASLTEG